MSVSDMADEYYIECFGSIGWYFCSRLHGLQRAIEWAAAFRAVKNEPARVRPVDRPRLVAASMYL